MISSPLFARRFDLLQPDFVESAVESPGLASGGAGLG
jgi:hypothetical protein